MLPPFIIEQIRQREERERARQGAEQPRLELPLDGPPPGAHPRGKKHSDDPDADEPNPDRGVIVLDII